MPVLGDGENIVPTIHVKDLAAYVLKMAENPPEEKKYLLAFDKSTKNTQSDILTALTYNIGPRAIVHTEQHELFTRRMKEILSINLKMTQSAPLSNEEDDEPADGSVEFEWFARVISVELKFRKEFLKIVKRFSKNSAEFIVND